MSLRCLTFSIYGELNHLYLCPKETCEVTDDCSDGLVCQNQNCKPCFKSGQCPFGHYCKDGSCKKEEIEDKCDTSLVRFYNSPSLNLDWDNSQSTPELCILGYILSYWLLFQDCKRDACCQGGRCLKTCFKTNKCDKAITIGGITQVSNDQCFEGFCRPRCREDFECHGGKIPLQIFCASCAWNHNSTQWKPWFFQYKQV